jgi:hypothetical protein
MTASLGRISMRVKDPVPGRKASEGEESEMATCDVCGNDYPKAFRIIQADGTAATFDSFECAIHRIAPRCSHCGCSIIGHGVEADGAMYCCSHCARHATSSST